MLVADCFKYFATLKSWSREFITEYLSPKLKVLMNGKARDIIR
jgi:hypothetical protein